MFIASSYLVEIFNSLQLCVIFLDSEGEPTQELSAIAMSVANHHILDIYHAYAQRNYPDDYARRHVHGLNSAFLKSNGFANEAALVENFKKWLRGRDIICMYANNPDKERKFLDIQSICDMNYPCWIDRVPLLSHKTALQFKRLTVPVTAINCFVSCPRAAHKDFAFYPTPRQSPTELVKKDFGYHCALYDTYALYLHFLIDMKEI